LGSLGHLVFSVIRTFQNRLQRDDQLCWYIVLIILLHHLEQFWLQKILQGWFPIVHFINFLGSLSPDYFWLDVKDQAEHLSDQQQAGRWALGALHLRDIGCLKLRNSFHSFIVDWHDLFERFVAIFFNQGCLVLFFFGESGLFTSCFFLFLDLFPLDFDFLLLLLGFFGGLLALGN
jgi:hypothetical protein